MKIVNHHTQVEFALLIGSALLVAAVLASKASSRLGIPSLLLFLVVGMLAGEDGPGGIPFDDAPLAQSLGVVALAIILYTGGLETRWESVSALVWRALSLSTAGVLLTTGLVGAFASWCLHISLLEGLLLGAVVSPTDAAAVFSVLRSHGVKLKDSIAELLELESGTNDPMAVFLTLALIGLLKEPGSAVASLLGSFVLQMALGLAIGVVAGRAATWLLNRIRLDTEGLYPVLMLALVLLIYSGASVVRGNGFLAVYVAGIVMGNANLIHKRSLTRFHDGLAWLMQIVMFLALGLLVYPSRLVPVAGPALLMACFLLFVGRPLSVFLSLGLSRLSVRSKLMISWVGLRGAVPIVLATFPLLAGVRGADLFFNVVFFIVLTSVLLQGTTLPVVARWLDVIAPSEPSRVSPLDSLPLSTATSEMMQIEVPRGSSVAGKQLVDVRLPKSALVVLVSRDEDYLVPRGGTVLLEGDLLMVLAERDAADEIRKLLNGNG